MASQQRQKRPEEPPHETSLINQEEKTIVRNVLHGHSKQFKIVSSAVVELYKAAPSPTTWTRDCAGVACLVRDAKARSYFVRVVDIDQQKLALNQELYKELTYTAHQNFFHTFAGDKYMIGLNFHKDEAKDPTEFERRVKKILRRQAKHKKRRAPAGGPKSAPPARASAPKPAAPTTQTMISQPSTSSISSSRSKKGKKGQVRKKLDKSQISLPSNFKHLSHIGWDAESGFDASNIPAEWKTLLEKAGVTEEQMQDKDTAEFVVKFVEEQGGLGLLNQGPGKGGRGPPAAPAGRGPPPPPPNPASASRGPPSVHPPPPPPNPNKGSRSGPPPPAPSRIGNKPPPPRGPPGPPSRGGGGPPPPPPPAPAGGMVPPPPSGGGPPPPPPPAPGGMGIPPPPAPGGAPKPPMASSGGGGGGGGGGEQRGGLLAQIQLGKSLRKVDDAEKHISAVAGGSGAAPAGGDAGLDGLAGALSAALNARRGNIMSDDDDGDSDDGGDSWSDDSDSD